MYAISFGSRKLDRHQVNYSITEKELLAMVTGLTYYKRYLLGNKVIAVVDHLPLKYLITHPLNDSRMARWLATIQRYDLHIVYKPGKTHTVADYLSRTVPVAFTSISTNH